MAAQRSGGRERSLAGVMKQTCAPDICRLAGMGGFFFFFIFFLVYPSSKSNGAPLSGCNISVSTVDLVARSFPSSPDLFLNRSFVR